MLPLQIRALQKQASEKQNKAKQPNPVTRLKQLSTLLLSLLIHQLPHWPLFYSGELSALPRYLFLFPWLSGFVKHSGSSVSPRPGFAYHNSASHFSARKSRVTGKEFLSALLGFLRVKCLHRVRGT